MEAKIGGVRRGAEFSDCKKHRYVLWRIWDAKSPMVLCIGLNPSTANAISDDNTIGILTRVLLEKGYGGFYMGNLFSLISSNPDDLRACTDPIKDNDKYLSWCAARSKDVIFCWGAFPMAAYRAKKMRVLFKEALCFGRNADKSPYHPRALSYKGMLNSPPLYKF